MTSPQDAIATYTNDAIKAKLISYLQSAQTPVTDWHDVGFLRSLLVTWGESALGTVLNPADPDASVRQMLVAGVVPQLAARPTPKTTGWLTLSAEQLFGVRRNFDLDGAQFAGTFTQQAVTLSCDASHGPYNVAAGAFWVRSPVTGNRYKAISSGTIPNNGSVIITFQAESPNDSISGQNFADDADTLTDLGDNRLEGVTASNVAPDFSGVTPTPSPALGLGVVTVGGATPASATAYDVKITLSGQVGAALFQYRSNGGSWSADIATAASYVIPSGPTVHFTNDGTANPSFIVDDVYSFQSPGTPITQQGLDPETDAALLIRCAARFPDLQDVPTEDKHATWAKAADALVTRVRVSKVVRPGFLDIRIAGVTNPLSGGVVTAVQDYIDQHEAIGDQSVVGTATVQTVTSTGTVYVRAADKAAIQAAAAALWNPYVNATDIGGVVRLAKLEEFLMDAGATDLGDDLQLNGSGNVNLPSDKVAEAVDIIAAGLTWVDV